MIQWTKKERRVSYEKNALPRLAAFCSALRLRPFLPVAADFRTQRDNAVSGRAQPLPRAVTDGDAGAGADGDTGAGTAGHAGAGGDL